ncbi:unnamed protein product [Didymodactylos carnosus]|uniref:Uncharacterized protein n=1 Tax=Didymodactylos carnosus TaxID=1234261 RepID=A0A8S2DK00_9BILA|nr:unnamed protein product [Didymodactylos carnosus]CAF3702082.1 unnamed protein product [Didymodactylos carnosus]
MYAQFVTKKCMPKMVRSEEESVEPTVKLHSMDHLLNTVGHLGRTFNAEWKPIDVREDHNQAWYRIMWKEVSNLATLAKAGNLKDQNFNFFHLVDKFRDGLHWSTTPWSSREEIFQMIAGAFRDAVEIKQAMPRNVLDAMTDRLLGTNNTIHRKCAETLLFVVKNRQSLSEQQMEQIENKLKHANDTGAKQHLIELYAFPEPKEISTLLTHADRNQPLPKSIDELLRQIYYDPNGTVMERLMEEGAKRYIHGFANDFVDKYHKSELQIDPHAEEKLGQVVERCHTEGGKLANMSEELALNVKGGKQGGVVELCVMAMLTKKPITVLQQQLNGEASEGNGSVQMVHTSSTIDKTTGKMIDGHYELASDTTAKGSPNDCLYTAILSKTHAQFPSANEMRCIHIDQSGLHLWNSSGFEHHQSDSKSASLERIDGRSKDNGVVQVDYDISVKKPRQKDFNMHLSVNADEANAKYKQDDHYGGVMWADGQKKTTIHKFLPDGELQSRRPLGKTAQPEKQEEPKRILTGKPLPTGETVTYTKTVWRYPPSSKDRK